jgi:hypothetical protein
LKFSHAARRVALADRPRRAITLQQLQFQQSFASGRLI